MGNTARIRSVASALALGMVVVAVAPAWAEPPGLHPLIPRKEDIKADEVAPKADDLTSNKGLKKTKTVDPDQDRPTKPEKADGKGQDK